MGTQYNNFLFNLRVSEYLCVRQFKNLIAFLLQSKKNQGQPVSQFKAFAMAHMGKADEGLNYDPNQPASSFTNANIQARLDGYTSMAREVHGADYDPLEHDLDGEVVMRAGGGKKHGRFWLGDGALDTDSTPTLSQLKARSTSSSAPIRPRPEPTRIAMNELQVSSIYITIYDLYMLFIRVFMTFR